MLTYNQDVVELLDAVNLGQELVDDGVVDAGAARHAASLFANGIDFIKDDDMKPTIGSQLEETHIKVSFHRFISTQ